MVSNLDLAWNLGEKKLDLVWNGFGMEFGMEFGGESGGMLFRRIISDTMEFWDIFFFCTSTVPTKQSLEGKPWNFSRKWRQGNLHKKYIESHVWSKLKSVSNN